mgnify:CR=1 FL=1
MTIDTNNLNEELIEKHYKETFEKYKLNYKEYSLSLTFYQMNHI